MKDRDIQRAVKPQRFERSPGDAPSLGRVGRIPNVSQSTGGGRRKMRGEGGRGNRDRNNRKLVVVTWSVALAVIAVLCLGFAVWSGLRSGIKRDSIASGEREEVREAGQKLVVEKRVESRFESPSEGEVLGLVKRALAIRDPAKVEKCFHLGTASPGQVVGFLEKLKVTDGRIDGFTWLGSMDANGLFIDGVLVKTIRDGVPYSRLAQLTPDADGEWKIDFNAFARTVEPSWSELLGENATEGTVRVIVSKDTYFNGPFMDDLQWDCYGMFSPDTEVMMLGYCRRGTPQARAMARMTTEDAMAGMQGRLSPKRVTLVIRRVEGSAQRQFEIARVMAEDWVLSTKPFDENFE